MNLFKWINFGFQGQNFKKFSNDILVLFLLIILVSLLLVLFVFLADIIELI